MKKDKTIQNLILFLIIILMVSAGCNKPIDTEDLKIINNIVLGVSVDEFDKRYIDNGKIMTEEFSFQNQFQLSEHQHYPMSVLTTSIFDFPKYKLQISDRRHLGLIIPNTHPGTENITAVDVLLVMAAERIRANTSSRFFGETLVGKSVDQRVNASLLNDVADLLIRRYGEPSIEKGRSSTAYLELKFGESSRLRVGDNQVGRVYRWETDAIIVSFFEGIYDTSLLIYDLELNTYINPFTEDIYRESLEKEDVYPCYYGAYIRYEMKDEVIKKLKLDVPKI